MIPVDAETIQREYQQLQEHITSLHEMLASPNGNSGWPETLRERLQLFHGDLLSYFEKQEENGFLDQVELHAPNMHDQVTALHREHDRLLQDVERLKDQLISASPSTLEEHCKEFGDFLNHLQDHEDRKNKLVLQAFTVEPSAAD